MYWKLLPVFIVQIIHMHERGWVFFEIRIWNSINILLCTLLTRPEQLLTIPFQLYLPNYNLNCWNNTQKKCCYMYIQLLLLFRWIFYDRWRCKWFSNINKTFQRPQICCSQFDCKLRSSWDNSFKVVHKYIKNNWNNEDLIDVKPVESLNNKSSKCQINVYLVSAINGVRWVFDFLPLKLYWNERLIRQFSYKDYWYTYFMDVFW